MANLVVIQSKANSQVQKIRKAYASVLTKYIKNSGWDIEEVAHQIKIGSVPFYNRVLLGKGALSVEVLHDICKVIKVSPESIVGEVYKKIGNSDFKKNRGIN
jgi:hypothetical protein